MLAAIKSSQATVNRVKRGQRLEKVLSTPYHPPTTLKKSKSFKSTTNTRKRKKLIRKRSEQKQADGFDNLKEWRGHVNNFRKRYHAARQREDPRHRRTSEYNKNTSADTDEQEYNKSTTATTATTPSLPSPPTPTLPKSVSFSDRLAIAESQTTLLSSTSSTSLSSEITIPKTVSFADSSSSTVNQNNHQNNNQNTAPSTSQPQYTSSLEYAPGTGLLYGSRVCFQSCQKKFLHINATHTNSNNQNNSHHKHRSAETTSPCTAYEVDDNDLNFIEGNVPPPFATRLQLLNVADPSDRSQVKYGDQVWLGVDPSYRHDHGVNYGGHFLGQKIVAKSDTKGGGSSSIMIPSVIEKRSVRGMELARWVIVHPNGHVQGTKGAPVGHMDEIRLELEFVCLGCKTESNGTDVKIMMMNVGGMTQQAQKTRKMSETVERLLGSSNKNKSQTVSSSSLKSTSTSHKKKKPKVKLTAGWGTSWRIYLSELAKDNGTDENNREQKDPGDKVLLEAQNKLLQSRSKRRERGDKEWVYEINLSRNQTEKKSQEMCARAAAERNGGDAEEEEENQEEKHLNFEKERNADDTTTMEDGVESMVNTTSSSSKQSSKSLSFLRARYAIKSTEGFSIKKRGKFWKEVEKRERTTKQNQLLQGNAIDGNNDMHLNEGKNYFYEMLNKKKENSKKIDKDNHRVELDDDIDDDVEEEDEAAWPDLQMNKVEKARALANAAELEAKIKSSVWSVVGRHRHFLQAQEEHRLLIAVTALQRAVRAWIRTRWKRRFEGEDIDINVQLTEEKEKQRLKLQQMKEERRKRNVNDTLGKSFGNDEQNAHSLDLSWKKTISNQMPSRKVQKPTVRLVPSRKLRWSMSSVRERAREKQRVAVQQKKMYNVKQLKARPLEIQPPGNKTNANENVDPRLLNVLRETPESSKIEDSPMLTTSLPLQQPPPEILNLGTSLWAGSLQSASNLQHVLDTESSQMNDSIVSPNEMMDRAGGVMRKSKSEHLRRLRLLPPSVTMDHMEEYMYTGSGNTGGNSGVNGGGGGLSYDRYDPDSMNEMNAMQQEEEEEYDRRERENLLNHSLVSSMMSSSSSNNYNSNKKTKKTAKMRPSSALGTRRGRQNKSNISKSNSYNNHNRRQRPSSAVATRSSRHSSHSSHSSSTRSRTLQSASRSTNRARKEIKQSKMMLSGLSLGQANKMQGVKRSQSSFAARLQQSIINGRRSQSVGLL